MSENVFGRANYVDKIKKYAESPDVGNLAFLGVKGVGKTSLFLYYFTKAKKEEIAGRYKKLFVYSRLDSRKQGSDLYHFLLDQVKVGIREIPVEDDKQKIIKEMDDINAVFDTLDARLTQYLMVVKEMGYDLVIIMDQFHCMARDTEVGREQYDVLRSFNEQKLITYWIITDTDLLETCATKQYIASFFAQKFTSKLTICPLGDGERTEAVHFFANQKKCELLDSETDLVADISGGVPELMAILIDILCMAKQDNIEVTKEELIRRFLIHDGGISLFKNWITGLNSKQKELLFEIASSQRGLNENNTMVESSKLAELSDDVGRGLLHIIKDNDEKTWNINIDLFRQYIVDCGSDFYLETEKETTNSDALPLSESRVTNIYNIEGNFINSQTNNILNIENAITGLEDLQKLVSGNTLLLEEGQVSKKLEFLPFRQEVWTEMNEEEQEQELEKYAEGVFSSDIFSRGDLTTEQMKEFYLNESILESLSDACRNQIICGIQVYNLIQLCIDNFGLNMNESESPRGILFARAFERHLKDYMAPAFYRIPEMASQQVYPTTKEFKVYPIDKTTIGTYSTLLGQGYKIFAQASIQLLEYEDKDEIWWKRLVSRLSRIGDLRNKCCHSGTEFGNKDLLNLKTMIFTDRSLEDILLFEQIPVLERNQFSSVSSKHRSGSKTIITRDSKKSSYVQPDTFLLGKTVKFVIKEKTIRGNFRGIVDGKYEGSLPKKYAEKMDFGTVKDTQIEVMAENIQDGKYILKK
ncbi:MAG: ATP-binding protein [Lachnospiraceae bacterium]|nr:ATP-binding protein [Lachnospiraceae bacterium]